MKDLEPHDPREERIKAILEHPLDTEADWIEVARLIDDDAVLTNEDRPRERRRIEYLDLESGLPLQ